MLDHTHDASVTSWVDFTDTHPDFPLQNLPLGIFSVGDGTPRPGVAIGHHVLDLAVLAETGLLPPALTAAIRRTGPTLNYLLGVTLPGTGQLARIALRHALHALLRLGAPERPRLLPLLHLAQDCRMHLPLAVGDYTDFFAGIHHATNTGRLFRPGGEPLAPNYKFMPIGYHGRASTLVPSGTAIRRPNGQLRPAGADLPVFGPCAWLDYELELGIWIGAGNEQGTPIGIADAGAHIGGYCLLNDWSARDMQRWESQPLGPFLSKSFASTISPWVVTPEALAPFRLPAMARGPADPPLLAYLDDPEDQRQGGIGLGFEVLIRSAAHRRTGQVAQLLSQSSGGNLYWTPAQMVAHHASNGCALRAGDLLGSGTISGPGPGGEGSLLELTEAGRKELALSTGEKRTFLEDGDEVILLARAVREGFAGIGFGACRGEILPALG